MQRILQPGDIESLDPTSFPRVLLPQLPGLFVERAARLRQLAEGNPIADYLRFVAQIVDAQAKAAGQLTLAEPDAALIARAQEHSMPHRDRKSTRLNSSHSQISYAVFCLKKKKKRSRTLAL